ncbi:Yip1 domain-containing protein [Paenibacillus sp. UNC496MF]|uniref:Yip1 family protein n=1 Tax=Paenibacillus sp. UNC496MF TaxID=1502753 RepID=UPI0008F3A11A|nr:Yip1 family protein [Paenibacillus sp. UNC496MF]SFJ33478.1 Yip1 domain-containing protein [Paenibacillus sp. UNC496MF]
MKQDFLKFPLHLIVRPFDGFWDMKYEGKGKLKVALLILLALVLTTILQKQFAGFLVNMADPRTLNSLDDLEFTILPFLLFCIANWSITTLMEGEGKFKEIVMATGYALLPIVLINLPMTFVSRFMTQEETAFYYLLNSISSLWFVVMLFVGIMTVHQYTPAKTVLTMALTVIAMGFVVFIATLAFSLGSQIYWFIYDVYRELIFRT